MTINAQDSGLLGGLFADPELARLFSDSATIRAMMIVEGTLAKTILSEPEEITSMNGQKLPLKAQVTNPISHTMKLKN